MNYRALLLFALTVSAPATSRADDAGTPRAPEPDYSRCGQMRAMPDWCREHAERERERERERVRVRDERGGR